MAEGACGSSSATSLKDVCSAGLKAWIRLGTSAENPPGIPGWIDLSDDPLEGCFSAAAAARLSCGTTVFTSGFSAGDSRVLVAIGTPAMLERKSWKCVATDFLRASFWNGRTKYWI